MANSWDGKGQLLRGLGEMVAKVPMEKWHQPYLKPKPLVETPSTGGYVGASSESRGEIGTRFVGVLNGRRHQSFDLQELNINVPTLENFTINPKFEEFYIVADFDPGTGPREEMVQVCSLLGLLRCELDAAPTVSVVLTLWKYIMGDANYNQSYGKAAKESQMKCMAGSMLELYELCELTPQEIITVAPPEDTWQYITSHVLYIAFAVTQLMMIKQLTDNNYDNYWKNRIVSLCQRLGLNQEQEELLLNYAKPSRRSCKNIYSRIGNRLPFRRMAYAIMRMFHSHKNQDLRGVASILKSMYHNIDITHLVLIQKYLIDMAPGILAAPAARGEAPAVFKAMLRLTQMEDEHPFVRMIYDPSETPELQSSNMPLLASLARSIAVKENPSYGYYEGFKSDDFKASLYALKQDYNNIMPVVTRTGDLLLRSEYRDDQATQVIGALQRDATTTTTYISSFLDALSSMDN